MEKFLKSKNEYKSDNPPSQKATFLCKFNPDFLKYVFVNRGNEADLRAQCAKCGLMLPNEALN